MPAAAQPEYEFSIEITTGMSAPPIGMMIRKPITKASPVISQNHCGFASRQNITISAITTRPRARLSRC